MIPGRPRTERVDDAGFVNGLDASLAVDGAEVGLGLSHLSGKLGDSCIREDRPQVGRSLEILELACNGARPAAALKWLRGSCRFVVLGPTAPDTTM